MPRVINICNQDVARGMMKVGKCLDQRFCVLIAFDCNTSYAWRKHMGFNNGRLWKFRFDQISYVLPLEKQR